MGNHFHLLVETPQSNLLEVAILEMEMVGRRCGWQRHKQFHVLLDMDRRATGHGQLPDGVECRAQEFNCLSECALTRRTQTGAYTRLVAPDLLKAEPSQPAPRPIRPQQRPLPYAIDTSDVRRHHFAFLCKTRCLINTSCRFIKSANCDIALRISPSSPDVKSRSAFSG